MVFVLRYVEGFELTECAAAIGVSLATLKRRLGRATESFGARARNEPALLDWIERGHRWTT
jgi:RNA polymerase sigma-70 factor (ECF subfamily)